MKKVKVSRKFFIAGLLILAFGFSAAFTAALTVKNNDRLQAEPTNQIVEVNLFKDEVLPATITLTVGQNMRINNKSSVARELSLGSGTAHETGHDDNKAHDDDQKDEHETQEAHDHASGFSTGLFAPDEAWEGSFSEPGTYFMHDHDNPDINILVVVYNEE